MLSEHISQGRRIDNYHILAEIGSGPTCSVFLAEHLLHPQNTLALKLFHRKLISKKKRELFLQEAQLLKKIKHAHILPILDAGIFEDMPYYVRTYVAKGSLRNFLDSQSPRLLPIQESFTILRVVGQALQYTHQMNILHGDLKPENILFRNAGDVLLTDFSVATLQDTFNTGHDYNSSSFPYMAPEQFLGRMIKESDQYALGCIAYELLTGQVPFIATSYAGFKDKHTAEVAIAPTQHNLLLPVSSEEAILKALQKKSDDRYPTIKDFVTALCSSTQAQQRGLIPARSTAIVVTTSPWLVTQKRSAETQSINEPLKEQSGNYLRPILEIAPLADHTVRSYLKEDGYVRSQAGMEVSAPQESRVFQPGGVHTSPQTATTNSSAKPGTPFLTDTSAKVARIVAPMYRDNQVKHASIENKRSASLVWAIALGLLVALLGITTSLIFFTAPSTHSPQSNPTAIAHTAIPAVAPTPTAVLTPTTTTTHTLPTPPPASKAAPVLVPSPTATPTPIPTSGLTITPASFQLSQDCFNQGNRYICSANLLLPDNQQGNLAWSASGSGANINFNPAAGTLSPGEERQVTIFIPRACPLSGTLSFSTNSGTTTVPWSC